MVVLEDLNKNQEVSKESQKKDANRCAGLSDLKLPNAQTFIDCLTEKNHKNASPEELKQAHSKQREMQIGYSNQIDEIVKKKGVHRWLDPFTNMHDAMESQPDTIRGKLAKAIAGESSPNQDHLPSVPEVQVLMKEVDKIEGTRLEVLEKVYNLVSDAMIHPARLEEGDPRIGANPSQDFGLAMRNGVGDCNIQSILVSYALEQKGFETDIVGTPTHAWVRVTIPNPETGGSLVFDLEPSMDQPFNPFLKQKTSS